jgi:hypothetical protein
VEVTAEIIDSIALEPEILDLGTVIRGQRVTGTITLKSVGIGDFEVLRMIGMVKYLEFSAVKKAGGTDAAYAIELTTLDNPPLGEIKVPVKLAIKNEHIDTTSFQVKMNVLPKVSFRLNDLAVEEDLDFGVFPMNEGKELTVDMVNLAPQVHPYHPRKIEVIDSRFSAMIETRLDTIKEGEHYKLRVKIKPGQVVAQFITARIDVFSDHPDLLHKRIHVLGWPRRAEGAGSSKR